MARHRFGSRRTPFVLIAIAAIVLNVVAATGLHALGVSLFPQTAKAQAAPAPAQAAPVAKRSGPLPAEQVFTQVLATGPTTLPGGGWSDGTDPGGALGTPFDFPCGTPDGPGPVLVRAHGWSQTTGPLPSDLHAAVTLSLRAYGAGGGASAFAALSTLVHGCPGVSAGPAGGLGVQALSARTGQASALIWRRGDVLAVLTYQASGAAGNLGAVSPLAAEYDGRLATALAQACPEQNSTLADATRSPYLDRSAFTGLTVQQTVTLDPTFQAKADADEAAATAAAASSAAALSGFTGTPTTPAAPSAVPAAGAPSSTTAPSASATPSVVPIPAPTPPLPTVGALPTPPTGVNEPEQLPAPVTQPTPPAAPAQPATSTTVPERAADPTGPGCGWAFTGQAAPAFNSTTSAADLQAAQDKAQTGLQQNYTTWLKQRDTYYADYATYTSQATAYLAYVQQVAAIRTAWTSDAAAQAAYTTALTQYQDAVNAYNTFQAQQQQAMAAYNAAVQACVIATANDVTAGALSGAQTGGASTPSVAGARPAPQPALKPAAATSALPTNSPTSAPTSSNGSSSTPSSGPTGTSSAPSTSAAPTPTSSAPTPGSTGGSTVNPPPTTGSSPVQSTCPAPRPAILDQQPPTVPASPTPPAPRPAIPAATTPAMPPALPTTSAAPSR